MTGEKAVVKIPKKMGRPSLDWEGLYVEWLHSGKKKAVFLREKGINPTSGAASRNTNTWTRDTQDAHKKIVKEASQPFESETIEMEAITDPEIVPDASKEVKDLSGEPKEYLGTRKEDKDSSGELQDDPGVLKEIKDPVGEKKIEYRRTDREPQAQPPTEEINEIWQIVQGWRKNQAVSDYRIADNIKLHIKAILNGSVVRKVDKDGKEVLTSALKSNDIKNITQSLESIQRIQRLALGMSTENVGIDGMVRTEVNVQSDPDDDCPVFVVEVNKNGKFERARPTKVR